MSMKHLNRFLMAVAGLVLLYLATFGLNAFFGGYTLLPSGKYRPLSGLALGDTWVWQPRYGTFHFFLAATGKRSTIADPPGYFYAPAILLVQRWVKPSASTGMAEGGPSYQPPPEQIHPVLQALFDEMDLGREQGGQVISVDQPILFEVALPLKMK